jgi:hypothetical protein
MFDEVGCNPVLMRSGAKGGSLFMPASNGHDDEPRFAYYLLPRAFRQNGKANAPRKERLACAFVELRQRIKDEFLKVAKDWQVSAEELRRSYSHEYPPSTPDLLCLEQGCEGLLLELRSSIQTYAEQYGVPDDMLEAMLVDWLVSDRIGTERTPARLFSEAAPENTEEGHS